MSLRSGRLRETDKIRGGTDRQNTDYHRLPHFRPYAMIRPYKMITSLFLLSTMLFLPCCFGPDDPAEQRAQRAEKATGDILIGAVGAMGRRS